MAHRLLGSQESAVFVAIDEVGFSPHDFRFSDAKLTHTSGAFFNVSSNPRGRFVTTCEPGEERVQDVRRFNSWTGALEEVHRWLGYLRRELETPDLWARLAAGEQLPQASSAAEPGTVFAPDEVAQIERELAALKEQIQRNHELTKGQVELINDELDHLVRLARTEPRSHWRAMFIGYFASYVLEALLPPDVVREVVVAGLLSLAHLFGSGMPELPSGGNPPVSLN